MLLKFCFIYAITNKQETFLETVQVLSGSGGGGGGGGGGGVVAGGIWWGTMKKYVFKRGSKEKMLGLKGEGTQKFLQILQWRHL